MTLEAASLAYRDDKTSRFVVADEPVRLMVGARVATATCRRCRPVYCALSARARAAWSHIVRSMPDPG